MVRWLLLSLLAATPAAAFAQPAPGSVEARLQRVEDELAIRRIIIAYATTQDDRDYDGYANLFAREGEWVNGKTVRKGRAAIRQLLVDLYGNPPPGYVNAESFHLTSNAEVRLDGDRATATSRHVLILRGPEGQPQPVLSGRYEDEFIREDGEWKILRRTDNPVMPTREEWMKWIQARRAAKAE